MNTGFMMFLVNSLLAMTLAYTDLDDSFDFESMTKNSDSLKKMVDCFYDRQPCDDVLKHYKNHVKQSLEDSCAECSTLQKHHYKQFLEGLKKFFPQDYIQYTKFDPNSKTNEVKELEKEVFKY